MKQSSQSERARALYELYSRDISVEDLQRLFTHDTRDAYRFFTRGLDEEAIRRLPWWKQLGGRIRQMLRGRFTPPRLAALGAGLARPSSNGATGRSSPAFIATP